MPITVSPAYRRPWWLPGGVLQTIWAFLLGSQAVPYRRERLELDDGDFIDLDWLEPTPQLSAEPMPMQTQPPLLVMFHGLEGSSQSHYCRNTMSAAVAHGWSGVVAHFRGCSGELNRLRRSYHSGDSDHCGRVLCEMRKRWPERTIFAAGVSLGGNALTKWCGEQGDAAKQCINAAASVSSPLDLGISAEAMQRPGNWLISRYFMRAIGDSFAVRMSQFPDLQDRAFLRRPRSFPEFDHHYTAPEHGYTSGWDYYYRASSRRFIPQIRIPFLLLNAANDPFVPASIFPSTSEVPHNITLEQPSDGGHVAFVDGPFPGNLHWLPQRLCYFFAQHLPTSMADAPHAFKR